jgi:hypothetical protein
VIVAQLISKLLRTSELLTLGFFNTETHYSGRIIIGKPILHMNMYFENIEISDTPKKLGCHVHMASIFTPMTTEISLRYI